MTDKPNQGGRPPFQLTEEQLEELCGLSLRQCTFDEIAAHFDCSEDSIKRHYGDLVRRHRWLGKLAIRTELWADGMERGNTKSLHLLAKHYAQIVEPKPVTAIDNFFQPQLPPENLDVRDLIRIAREKT